MDVSAVSAESTAAATASAQDQMGVAVLRKSLDAESSVALELIQATNIPGLGENIDVQA
jgi:hypothetical protein